MRLILFSFRWCSVAIGRMENMTGSAEPMLLFLLDTVALHDEGRNAYKSVQVGANSLVSGLAVFVAADYEKSTTDIRATKLQDAVW